jgi:glycolate oxidase iron-sulfur subunit
VSAARAAGKPLALDEDELVACVSCGLCLPHCPTYRVTGLEIASPRGRLAAMRAVQLDGAPETAAFAAAMDACVQCRACEAACPSSVPFGRLMEGAREHLHDEPPAQRGLWRRISEWLGYRVVLPRHWLLLSLSWLMLVGQRLRLVPRRLGLPRLRGGALARRLPAVSASEASAFLFTGCVMDAWQRDVHRAAIDVLAAAGARVATPDGRGACCGALHMHAGRGAEARRLAERVITSMPGDAPIVVDSAGCGAAMQDYGLWLGTDAAAAFARRVHDFSEWLAASGAPPTRVMGVRVVVQDPCHLRNVQHAEEAVRTVLGPSYELIETDDDAMCCGAGGAYSLTEPDLSDAIRDRKVTRILEVAGDVPFVVASANPGCAMHLAAAGLDVRHPAELVAAAMETTTEGEDR